MKTRVNLFLFFVWCAAFVTETTAQSRSLYDDLKYDDAMDVSDFSVYYDINTNQTIKRMMPRPWYKPGWLLRLPFTGGPCTCDALQCKCCTGIRIPAFGFDRQTCTLLTYEPEMSIIDMEVNMNNASVYRNTFSARNPPPLCIPIPVPYLPPGLVDMCVRLFDITVVNQMLHVCMDMDTRVDKAPVLVLHFDCMDMGAGGVGLSKPGGSDANSSPPGDGTMAEPTQLDSDVYDPVTESFETTKNPTIGNSIKYI